MAEKLKELWFQKRICSIIDELGGFAEIISHRFKAGVPDLLIKYPGSKLPFLIECKIITDKQLDSLFIKNPLSSIQYQYIKKAKERGIKVFLLIGVKYPNHYGMVLIERTDIPNYSCRFVGDKLHLCKYIKSEAVAQLFTEALKDDPDFCFDEV